MKKKALQFRKNRLILHMSLQKRTYMKLQNLKPPIGRDTYRIGDSDDLVVTENVCTIPSGTFYMEDYGLIIVCTSGRAQLEYDGVLTQMKENDLFLYMAHSVASNFMATTDFRCRQIWFSRSGLFNINIFTQASLADIPHLKLNPVTHLNGEEVKLLDNYFDLIISRMKNISVGLYPDIARALIGTMMLEMMEIMRRTKPENRAFHDSMQAMAFAAEENSGRVHKRRITDQFMRLVEQSDGRIRKVEEYANMLNVTPKYLSTVMKEVMNRKPSVFIKLFTMRAIEHRLRYTDMTMQEIANDLKFPNASFFGKYFKEQMGMTPMEYRVKYYAKTKR